MTTGHYNPLPMSGPYDPDHPYKSRYKQWGAPGKYVGRLAGAALAGKHFFDKGPGVAIPAILAGGIGGGLLGEAATGLPGLVHGAINQRQDRPHEWNEDMSNAMDHLKDHLAVKTSAKKDRYGLAPLFDKVADDYVTDRNEVPWLNAVPLVGPAVTGYQRGKPSGRELEGALRGLAGGAAGGYIASGMGAAPLNRFTGLTGALGNMYLGHLATQGLVPKKEEASAKVADAMDGSMGILDAVPLVGPTYKGYQRGKPSGREFQGALRGLLGSQLGGAIGHQASRLHPALGLPGSIVGHMYGSNLSTRGLLPEKEEASPEKAAAFTTTLRPNQIEEQAFNDAFAHYKIAAPIGNMLRGAWQGAKALGTNLGTAGGAMKGTFQANKAFSTPMLSNLGQTAQAGFDSLKQTGAIKPLKRIGTLGAMGGAGYLAGRAMSPSAQQQQQQQMPPNPYGHVL